MEGVAPDEQKTGITLFELYAVGIERLIEKSPWELERAVSAYHESFLTEQRCLALTVLLMLGENHLPKGAVKALPEFEEQARASVNQAVFLRALKAYFKDKSLSVKRADMVMERMGSYIADWRRAAEIGVPVAETMLETVVKRVPPQDDDQYELYVIRVGKIYEYVEGLVGKGLLRRYEVSS